MSLRPAIAHLLAAVISLCLDLQLRWANQFGFYDNDYNHIWDFLHSDRALGRSWKNLAHHLLTDEPLFNVYHAVRYHLLGASPLPHHLLAGTLVAANAVLAFSLVWRLSRQYLFSFLFLFLFLTYPNRGEAHHWPGAVYAPMLFCLLGAAHLALSWFRGGRRWMYVACWIGYAAAVFTHEAASGFLAVFAALWALERWGQAGWREGALFLAPLAAANAGYLAVRQTRWFGLGQAGFLHLRPLDPGGIFANLRYSLDANFGEAFLVRTEHMAREGAATHSMLPALLLILGALLGLAALIDGRPLGPRIEGALALLAVVAGAALYTRQAPVPDLMITLRLLLRAAVLLALASGILTRLFRASRERGLLLVRLGAFGCVWFLAGYAPTYLLYIAPRHGYLPSVGVCLLLAAVLWLPATWVGDERYRRWLEGVALAIAACVGVGFYAACLGEAASWAGAAGFMSRFQAQVVRARPSLPPDTRVVILGVPLVWKEVPLLPNYALQAALRHWYGHYQILADREFVPRKQDFLFPGSSPQAYDRLALFTYEQEILRPVEQLVFEDGSTVWVGAALEDRSGEGTALRVTAGRPVGH